MSVAFGKCPVFHSDWVRTSSSISNAPEDQSVAASAALFIVM